MKSQNGSQKQLNSDMLLIFGNTPELSRLEVERVYTDSIKQSLSYGVISNMNDADTRLIIDRLGGTVKIVTGLLVQTEVTPDHIASYIHSNNLRRDFGISWYGEQNASYVQFVQETKALLGQYGHYRYVMPKKGTEIASSQIGGGVVSDIVIGKTGHGYIIGNTAEVQNYRFWSERDYGRPIRDTKIGMLPPKIARMAVNIALGKDTKDKIVHDPFCGLGTVLMESLMLGVKTYGSDVSPEVVSKAKTNISWFTQQQGISDQLYSIQVSDATHISQIIAQNSVDAIVTEPVMGPTSLGDMSVPAIRTRASNIMKGLTKLYIGCLNNWKGLLKDNGYVMIAFPEFHIHGRIISVKKLVDTCERLGYSTIAGPVVYGRHDATVKRQFYLLQKRL